MLTLFPWFFSQLSSYLSELLIKLLYPQQMTVILDCVCIFFLYYPTYCPFPPSVVCLTRYYWFTLFISFSAIQPVFSCYWSQFLVHIWKFPASQWQWADTFFHFNTLSVTPSRAATNPEPCDTSLFIFQTELNSKWQTFLSSISVSKFSPYGELDVI